ncbi:hypothetical protein OLX23_19055 [Novosphingobium sp. JCM 18896]|nr:hypothetical protein [Novosphingobium sp. JCM 18896]
MLSVERSSGNARRLRFVPANDRLAASRDNFIAKDLRDKRISGYRQYGSAGKCNETELVGLCAGARRFDAGCGLGGRSQGPGHAQLRREGA